MADAKTKELVERLRAEAAITISDKRANLFREAADALAAPQPAPSNVPHDVVRAWQWRSRIKGGAWDAWENGRYAQEVPPFMEVEERATPAPPTSTEEALRAENARLRAALEPFAGLAEIYAHKSGNRPTADKDPVMVVSDHRVGERGFTVGDLRTALSALSR